MTKQTPHTLEALAGQMQGNTAENDEIIHAAMMLAYYGAADTTVSCSEILRTPLFGVKYDAANNNFQMVNFDGVAKVTDKNMQTISSLDIIIACHARDMPLIFQGDTGVGKTITTEA